MISIRVHGTPAPQGSKRAFARPGGKPVVVEMSKAVGPWREAVRSETQDALEGSAGGWDSWPVTVTVVFMLPRPATHYRTGRNAHLLKDSAPVRPVTRPDLDKLVRSTLDGLKSGGAYTDDSQVTDLIAAKIYCVNGQAPGAEITIEPCKEDT